VTLFGLFLTPVFYVVLRRRRKQPEAVKDESVAPMMTATKTETH
jgi:HAE1 family hydrophobic/amphiphilic exporter-1